MHWTDLRDEFTELYPDGDTSRRVVEDALIPTRYMQFTGNSADMWERIMREANRRNKLIDIVRVAEREYPEREQIKVARILLESGVKLRDTPGEPMPEQMYTERNRDGYTDMMLDAIGAVREDLRALRKDGEERGEKLTSQLSDLRHESRREMAFVKPLVQSQGVQLKAQSEQLKAQSTQLDAHSTQLKAQAEMIKTNIRAIQSLEERPEQHANRMIIWIALAVGLTTVIGGEIITIVVRFLMTRFS